VDGELRDVSWILISDTRIVAIIILAFGQFEFVSFVSGKQILFPSVLHPWTIVISTPDTSPETNMACHCSETRPNTLRRATGTVYQFITNTRKQNAKGGDISVWT
jgi:hypothetical protein